MNDFSLERIWAWIQMAVATIGGWLGYFLGGNVVAQTGAEAAAPDRLLLALIIFMALDYLSGVLCAIAARRLSSAVGFRGICRKVLILVLVGVANAIDTLLSAGAALRSAVLIFYLSNEALSLTENAAQLGLPIPEKMKRVLAQLHGRAAGTDEDEEM
ncbi:MAG: phage holin family protein [Clostridia bacterium]|nr:phage holin family protein [Clostridia bacterium]